MFLFSVIEAIGMMAGLLFALPWALILLPVERRSTLLLALTTVALSVGTLTLWLLALALVGALTLGASLAGIAVIGLAGVAVAARRGELTLRTGYTDRVLHPLLYGALLITLIMVVLITFEALYWPFSDADAVAIYANHSRTIFQARAMPDGEGLYESYPMLLPLSYVYSYLLAGHINEYLARIVVAALAVGAFGAALELGRTLVNARVGALAALLLALTPSFVRWGPSGYADVPAAFFVTMVLIFTVRLTRDGDDHDALLLGIMIGLAAWTKNSVLPVAGSLALWLVLLFVQRRVTLRTGVAALVGVLATAGPWYARNVVQWGFLYSSTAWTDQAQHTLGNLIPFVTHPERFLAGGIVFTLGLGWALIAAWRGDPRQREGARLLLLAVLPLAAAWWWMVSYDTRFLLAVVPAIAVLGAWALDTLSAAVKRRVALDLTPARQIVLLLVIAALVLPSARKAVTHKSDLLRDPLMDNATRHQIALGPVYDVAGYLSGLAAEGRLLTDNHFLPFYAADEHRLEIVVGGLPERDALAAYDYLVFSGALPDVVVGAQDVELMMRIGDFGVFRVVYAD